MSVSTRHTALLDSALMPPDESTECSNLTGARRGRRLLQIANYADPLFLFHVPLCRSLQDAGWEIEFACMEGGSLASALADEGFPVHWLPRVEHRSLSGFLKTRRVIQAASRGWDHDVIMVSTPVMSWAVRQALRKGRAAVVYFAHGLAFSPNQNPIRYRVLRGIETFHARWTDAVVVVNDDDEAVGRQARLTRTVGSCYRLPGEGLAVARYATVPSKAETDAAVSSTRLRRGHPLVLYLSRFVSWKRPDDVLAIARARPDWDFVMIGEGPFWQRVHTRARASCPNVSVLPFTRNVVPWLHLATVLVHPSVFPEGMPRVILEAHAVGVPTVAYDNRGVRDAIPGPEYGTLVPPRDVRSLIAAVDAAVAVRDTPAAARDASLRREFVQRFSADRIGRELAGILDFVSEAHGSYCHQEQTRG